MGTRVGPEKERGPRHLGLARAAKAVMSHKSFRCHKQDDSTDKHNAAYVCSMRWALLWEKEDS